MHENFTKTKWSYKSKMAIWYQKYRYRVKLLDTQKIKKNRKKFTL